MAGEAGSGAPEGSASRAGAVDIAAVGPAACATVVWRRQGQLNVTVIVKATFAFVPDAPMTIAPPEEIVRREVHHQKNPGRSVRLTSDLAPFLPRADVVLNGHAHAPDGKRVQKLSVRLGVFRTGPLLDKAITVVGDSEGGTPQPFDRVALLYERAYGGIGSETNPLGVGFGSAATKQPNLLDPADPKKVACFGPLGQGWLLRRRLLGSVDRRALDAPIAELPADFDWAYYQAAPLDQRVDYLEGDEWVLLQGMHPSGLVRSRLPGARGLARVHGLPGASAAHEVKLLADTLRIDADALRCEVVWRGQVAVPSEAALSTISVVVGVESPGRPVVWPQPAPRPAAAVAPRAGASVPPPPPARVAAPVESRSDATVMIDEVTQDSAVVPFAARPAPSPGAPPPAAAAGDVPGGTLRLSSSQTERAVAAPVAPFRAAPELPARRAAEGPKPRTRSGRPVTDDPFSETLNDVPPPPPTLPFGRRAPYEPPSLARPAAPVILDPESEWAPDERPATETAAVATARGIRVFNETPLAVEIVAWDLTPSRACMTVVAKATCDLEPGKLASLRPAAEPPAGDVSAPGERGRCLVHPSDLVPFKVRADVVLVGHACPPSGAATSMEVALRFGHEDNRFERRIAVFGARRWEPGVASPRPSEPEPFQRMPLTYERAFGGPSFDANPAGVGHETPMDRRRGPRLLPNLEDPAQRIRTQKQAPKPACFAPLPAAWRDRPAASGRRAEAFACIPEAFDWTRHQAAPRAQQLAFLSGDEPFTATFVHPKHEELAGSLPGVRARCFAVRKAPSEGPRAGQGGWEEVALQLDTVVIDADKLELTLVWRGALPVADERSPDVAAVHLALEKTADEPMTPEAARALLVR